MDSCNLLTTSYLLATSYQLPATSYQLPVTNYNINCKSGKLNSFCCNIKSLKVYSSEPRFRGIHLEREKTWILDNLGIKVLDSNLNRFAIKKVSHSCLKKIFPRSVSFSPSSHFSLVPTKRRENNLNCFVSHLFSFFALPCHVGSIHQFPVEH